MAVILYHTNKWIHKKLKNIAGSEWFSPAFSVCSQALPYVALLIAMLFFIYAVIGMQVCVHIAEHCFFSSWHHVQLWALLRFNFFPELVFFFVCLFFVSGVWKGGHGGRHTYQQKQQLPDLPSGCAAALQVRPGRGFSVGCVRVCVCALHMHSESFVCVKPPDVPLERRGRRSCWPACQANCVTPSPTTTPGRRWRVAADLPSFILFPSTCSAPSWYAQFSRLFIFSSKNDLPCS